MDNAFGNIIPELERYIVDSELSITFFCNLQKILEYQHIYFYIIKYKLNNQTSNGYVSILKYV